MNANKKTDIANSIRHADTVFPKMLGVLLSYSFLLLLPKAALRSSAAELLVIIAVPVAVYLLGEKIGFANCSVYGLSACAILGALKYESIFVGVLHFVNNAHAEFDSSFIPYTFNGMSPENADTFLAVLFVTLVVSLLCVCGANLRKPLIAILPGCAVIFLIVYTGLEIPPVSFSPFAALSVLLVMVSQGKGISGRYIAAGVGVVAASLGIALIAAVLFSGSSAYEKSVKFNDDIANGIKQFAEDRIYLSDKEYTPLPNGNINDISPVYYSENTVMTVTMQAPVPVYFRTFVGLDYADGIWSDAADIYADNRRAFLYFADNGFYPLSQYGSFASMAYDTTYSNVKVKNEALSSKYIYAPHNAVASGILAGGSNIIEDYQVRSASLSQVRDYSFVIASPMVKDMVMDDALTKIKNRVTDEDKLSRFEEIENAYKTLVYDNYLSVSSDEDGLLRELFGDGEINALSSASHRKVTAVIRKYFEEEYEYSTEEELQQGFDALSGFIRNKAGYAPHFATLAALLYREAGIPARYAEGYALTENEVGMYREMNNITFEMPDSYAHAWVEIYINEIGWVPVEVTPGFFALEEGEESREGKEDVLVDDPSYFYLKEQEAEKDEEPEEPDPELLPDPEMTIPVSTIVAAMAIAAVLTILIIPLLKKKRRFSSFEKAGDARICARNMYAHGLRLLEFAGVGESVYMDDMKRKLAKAFESMDKEKTDDFVYTAYRSGFSEAEISTEMYQKMKATLFEMRDILKSRGAANRIKMYFKAL